jgi:HSP20 family protein
MVQQLDRRNEHKKQKAMIITKHTPARNFSVFDELFNTVPNNWNRDGRTQTFVPPANIKETSSTYELEVNAPGRNKEDIKINLEKGLLTVSYEQKQEEEKLIRKEFNYQSFKRSFSLDDKINAEAIEARYENGILKVSLPKKEEVKPAIKQIQIQ